MNYYSFHIGDWVRHTAHLTLEEEAVYRRLLDYYYESESAIPARTEPLIRRLRMIGHEKTVALILEEFFVLEEDGWHNKRADSEIEKYQRKAETAKKNGLVRKQSTNVDKPDGTNPLADRLPETSGSETNQEPITKNQEPLTKRGRTRARGREQHAASGDFPPTRGCDSAGLPAPEPPGPCGPERKTDCAAAGAGDFRPDRLPSAASAVCTALRSLGVAAVNPAHPKLLALLSAGVTIEDLVASARVCVGRGKPKFAYILAAAEGQQSDAKASAERVLGSGKNLASSGAGKLYGTSVGKVIFDGILDE